MTYLAPDSNSYYIMVDYQTKLIERYRMVDGIFQSLNGESDSQATIPIQLTGNCQIQLNTTDH